MGKSRKITNIIIIALVLSFIFALGAVSFAEVPTENNPEAPKEDRITKGLNTLIEKGVIKAEDAARIRDYLKADREEKRKVFDQMKGMNEEQRKEFIQNYRKDKVNVWDKMVEDKVITKEQAEEIRNIMPHHKQKDFRKRHQ